MDNGKQLQAINQQIETLSIEKSQVEKELEQLKNQEKKLRRVSSQEERKKRNHRLIVRGTKRVRTRRLKLKSRGNPAL